MKEINMYANSLFGEQDINCKNILNSLEERGIRNISVSAATGQWLTLLAKLQKSKRALEIGALGGYSGLAILKGLQPNGKLMSLELEEEYANLAKENITKAGFGDQVHYVIGDASESLKALKNSGEAFDFFFIDADKERYKEYVEHCVALAEDGALIVMDNVLVEGAVAESRLMETLSERKKARAQFMMEYNEYIAKHPRLFSTLLPIGDGVLCSIVQR